MCNPGTFVAFLWLCGAVVVTAYSAFLVAGQRGTRLRLEHGQSGLYRLQFINLG